MNKKIFFTSLIICMFLVVFSSYSFANNDMMNNARDSVTKAGNTVGGAITGTANAVVNGAKGLTNGVAAIGNSMANANGDRESDATNTMGNNNSDSMLGTTNGDYTATRTATNNGNLLGMSDNTWTWLILGIVGSAIVGLVWYYGKQFEHRNYSND